MKIIRLRLFCGVDFFLVIDLVFAEDMGAFFFTSVYFFYVSAYHLVKTLQRRTSFFPLWNSQSLYMPFAIF